MISMGSTIREPIIASILASQDELEPVCFHVRYVCDGSGGSPLREFSLKELLGDNRHVESVARGIEMVDGCTGNG